MMTMKKLDHTAHSLANMADTACPDTQESAGAQFLLRVQDWVNEALEYEEDLEDVRDRSGEGADGAVPVYTGEIWSAFVDLGAYREDPTELGCDGSDMDQAARVCLYMIADRLIHALLDEAEAEDDDS